MKAGFALVSLSCFLLFTYLSCPCVCKDASSPLLHSLLVNDSYSFIFLPLLLSCLNELILFFLHLNILFLSFVFFSFCSSRFPLPFPTSPFPFFFLCCSLIIFHSFLHVHHPLTTSSSLLFQTHSVVVHPSNVDSLGHQQHFDPLVTHSLACSHSIPFFLFFSVSVFCFHSSACKNPTSPYLYSFLSLSLSLLPFVSLLPPLPFFFLSLLLSSHPTLAPLFFDDALFSPCPLPTTFVYESTLTPSLSYMTHSQHHPFSFCGLSYMLLLVFLPIVF
ncbi:MAG: hypothetical protein JOS17DRAFT_574546 [Linnemannia elongata]|nr:MAG: hypothetical protein JOS17DRAFT_574546 [Linnemannia elongata]